ncbi:MAG: hypothetical protein ABIG95_07115, partial [Candidatus Woesearchaeota archaeon]
MHPLNYNVVFSTHQCSGTTIELPAQEAFAYMESKAVDLAQLNMGFSSLCIPLERISARNYCVSLNPQGTNVL